MNNIVDLWVSNVYPNLYKHYFHLFHVICFLYFFCQVHLKTLFIIPIIISAHTNQKITLYVDFWAKWNETENRRCSSQRNHHCSVHGKFKIVTPMVSCLWIAVQFVYNHNCGYHRICCYRKFMSESGLGGRNGGGNRPNKSSNSPLSRSPRSR